VGRVVEMFTALGNDAAKDRLSRRINKHVWTSGLSPKGFVL
jgi:hypothetical protein